MKKYVAYSPDEINKEVKRLTGHKNLSSIAI